MSIWKNKSIKFRIGMRTAKSAVAVMIAMTVVYFYGVTTSRIIFAVLGAMEAMQPTIKASLRSCLTQVTGVISGAIFGLALNALGLHPLITTGIGIVAVISIYNAFSIQFSPSLPCLIVVTICTTPDIAPIIYASGRIWDTLIGFAVGITINALIFPYDNRKQIRYTLESLDQELIRFLEDLFDGDDCLPDAKLMAEKVSTMASQMTVFSNQSLLMQRKRQQEDIRSFDVCQGKARELLARMEILSHMGTPGRLAEENRQALIDCGAVIQDNRPLTDPTERDIVVNYHVRQILRLRKELTEELHKSINAK
ncbi:MAG: FUSC family protein [Oscillospiraceae bacterium]|nr:FUSC family protein [Oscillospiraceae bacterium]